MSRFAVVCIPGTAIRIEQSSVAALSSPATSNGPLPASQRTPAAQSAITVSDLRQDGITRLADVRTYSLRGGESRIQLLYILEDDLELQPFGIDASVEHGIEHERVVRTRRNGKR